MNQYGRELDSQFYDIVIIGAGPAGIAAASALSKQDKKSILLVDYGRNHLGRLCPADIGLICNGCNAVCNVISGFGGSMHYGDAVKLSLLPSGQRLIDLFGEKLANELCQRSIGFFEDYCTASNLSEDLTLLEHINSFGINIKNYPVFDVSESNLKSWISKKNMELRDRIDISMRTKLISIEKLGSIFSLSFEKNNSLTNLVCKNVIFAAGRAGIKSQAKVIEDLRVASSKPKPSIGVRFEMPKKYLDAASAIHPDLKMAISSESGYKTKTFCFSSGYSGGRIKFCNYSDQFGEPVIFLDGHSRVEASDDVESAGNFAVLIQMDQLTDTSIFSWVKEKILLKYKELSNCYPVVQSYSDFKSGTCTENSWDDVRSKLEYESSIESLVYGKLDSLFDQKQKRAILELFEKAMKPILLASGYTSGFDELAKQIMVVGPEVEFFWDQPDLTIGCETSVNGLYMVGDATGIAQGIIQATMTGFSAADAIDVSETSAI